MKIFLIIYLISVLFFLLILSRYIFLSACSITCSMFTSRSFLVANPREMLIFILSSNFWILEAFLILLIISRASFSDVFGRNIMNSSPPRLVIISSFLQEFFIISEAAINNLSPFSWPKLSLTCFFKLISNLGWTFPLGKLYIKNSLNN